MGGIGSVWLEYVDVGCLFNETCHLPLIIKINLLGEDDDAGGNDTAD